MNDLGGRRVLVTGATGFIGSRLVEKLVLGEKARVRALVSSYSRCARIARFPVELRRADLLDAEAVAAAASDCTVVFHCAYGSRGKPAERRRVNVEGTENVLAAAARAGARVVHLSTQMVYGLRERTELDETCPRQPSGTSYADSKLEAEELVLRAAAAGLPATVLQPTAVYGPYAPVWTVGVLDRMRAGLVPLIAGGEGICNAVYIDDVVDAVLLAAKNEGAPGESFLISAAEPVTWREFYGSYEAMLGVPATVPVTVAAGGRGGRRYPSLLRELTALARDPAIRQRLLATSEGRFLGRLLRPLAKGRPGKTVTPELDRLKRLRREEGRQVMPVAAADAAFFASRTRVRIDKARLLLGYRPAFGLAAGMELTGAWARWAGLVPEQGRCGGPGGWSCLNDPEHAPAAGPASR